MRQKRKKGKLKGHEKEGSPAPLLLEGEEHHKIMSYVYIQNIHLNFLRHVYCKNSFDMFFDPGFLSSEPISLYNAL